MSLLSYVEIYNRAVIHIKAKNYAKFDEDHTYLKQGLCYSQIIRLHREIIYHKDLHLLSKYKSDMIPKLSVEWAVMADFKRGFEILSYSYKESYDLAAKHGRYSYIDYSMYAKNPMKYVILGLGHPESIDFYEKHYSFSQLEKENLREICKKMGYHRTIKRLNDE